MSDTTKTVLPTNPTERKAIPIVTGVLDYFPAAIAEVAKVSKAGNDQHNPGQPLHWARGKSNDHADTIARHLVDRGTIDKDGQRHSAKVAWRALALLQEELEAEGAAPGRGSRVGEVKPARAWNEGWVCGCGSTALYKAYRSDDYDLRPGAKGPVCSDMGCSQHMTRSDA